MDEDIKQDSDPNNSEKKAEPTAKDAARKTFGASEGIDDLRTRLYARGITPKARKRHALTSVRAVKRTSGRPPFSDTQSVPERREAEVEEQVVKARQEIHETAPQRPQVAHTPQPAVVPSEKRSDTQPEPMKKKTKHKKYRFIVVALGMLFFIGALALSSAFLFFGKNVISGENITIGVTAPFSIGGGQEMPLQIAISNQNTVPIEAATLIINYPSGTQSAVDLGREIFSDRRQLNNIAAGEVVNVPIKAVVFGEENEEKVIEVSVEYRVRGSNATFFKGADPVRFKISSSPVVLNVNADNSISSGQEFELELTVSSNSPTPLTNLLVKAAYPFGFDFSDASPQPVSGQDTWLIDSLDPEGEEVITLKGFVVGKQDEERIFSFTVGVANEREQFNLASLFTTAKHDVVLEDPFFGVDVDINGKPTAVASMSSRESASVNIHFENVLDDTIYEGVVEVKLSGNALDDVNISVLEGHYDSNSETITWDFVDLPDLAEIEPGRERNLSFEIKPTSDIGRTPEIRMEISVRGQRIFEDRVPQELVGTASRVVKISSDVTLSSSALYSDGPFVSTGPIPPVAEEVTQYMFLFSVDNTHNDITGAEMSATLPQYMTWLDLVTPGDDVTYNPVTRVITWDIGDVEADGHEEAWVQVSFLPSNSQVGKTPTILESQRLRATDRFTGDILRADAPALTTRLFNDPDESKREGKVQED